MIILIDNREQKPLRFLRSYANVDGTERTTLKVGDYAVRFNDNYIPPIRIERKSLGDLYGTLSGGYKRFKNEINRAVELGIERLYLFIECSYSDIEQGYKHSKREPETLIKQLNTLEWKHRLIFKCWNSRSEMARGIVDIFNAVGRQYVKDKRKK